MRKHFRCVPPGQKLTIQSFFAFQEYYAQSFQDILAYEGAENTPQTQSDFSATLLRIRERHADTVEMMAEAVMNIYNPHGNNAEEIDATIQYLLDRCVAGGESSYWWRR